MIEILYNLLNKRIFLIPRLKNLQIKAIETENIHNTYTVEIILKE